MECYTFTHVCGLLDLYTCGMLDIYPHVWSVRPLHVCEVLDLYTHVWGVRPFTHMCGTFTHVWSVRPLHACIVDYVPLLWLGCPRSLSSLLCGHGVGVECMLHAASVAYYVVTA